MSLIPSSLRFYRRKAGFTLVNLTGLSLGLAVFIILQLYVRQQRSYDQFWSDHTSLYRVETAWSEGGEDISYATAPPPLAPYLKDHSGIQGATRLLHWGHFTLRPDNDSTSVFRETNVYIADREFFRLFPERLLAGSEKAMDKPGSIVLSESALQKYFGQVDPENMIGRLILGGKDAGTLWEITGVMKDLPVTSHMQFDLMVSMWDEFSESNLWTWNVMHTYIRSDLEKEALDELLEEPVRDRVIPHLLAQDAIAGPEEADSYRFIATPMDEVHLQTGRRDAMTPGIRGSYLDILSLVSLLIIVLACVNFMNISTALAYERMHNVAVMKLHGATVFSLAARFMLEFLLQTVMSVLLAVGLVEFALLWINGVYQLQLNVSDIFTPGFLGMLSALVLFCTLASGAYPTWYLLRGKITTVLVGEKRHSRSTVRSVLIAGQFAISLFLISSTLIFDRQLSYLQGLDPGYDRENVLVIENDREIGERRQDFIDRITRSPYIVSGSFSTGLPAMNRYQLRDVEVMGSGERAPITWYESDQHYPEVMDIRILEGSTFTPGQADQILINERAVESLNLDEPVGTQLVINKGAQDEHKVVIKGVMANFHQRDFRTETEPLIIEYLDNYIFRDYIVLRYEAENAAQVIGDVRETWNQFEPEVPMQYFFLDSKFSEQFKSEQILRRLFGLFAILAVVIALIGLLGVAAISIRQRLREIGIRKVLGASSAGIILLVIRRFSLLIITACLVALPLTWLGFGSWLQRFTYQVELPVMLTLGAAGAIYLISMLLVVIQAWSASLVNPVKIIRKDS